MKLGDYMKKIRILVGVCVFILGLCGCQQYNQPLTVSFSSMLTKYPDKLVVNTCVGMFEMCILPRPEKGDYRLELWSIHNQQKKRIWDDMRETCGGDVALTYIEDSPKGTYTVFQACGDEQEDLLLVDSNLKVQILDAGKSNSNDPWDRSSSDPILWGIGDRSIIFGAGTPGSDGLFLYDFASGKCEKVLDDWTPRTLKWLKQDEVFEMRCTYWDGPQDFLLRIDLESGRIIKAKTLGSKRH